MSRPRIIDGWVEGARRLPSPNYNQRPKACIVDLLVIHNISLPPGHFGGPFVDRLFCNQLDPAGHPYFAAIAGLTVSSHLFVNRLGRLTQYVDLRERAWHAGASSFQGVPDCNDYSIGIELEGADDIAYSSRQYGALARVVAALVEAYPGISRDRIVGHCDVAPGRKSDPGPAFDWRRLFRNLEQLGAWAV